MKKHLLLFLLALSWSGLNAQVNIGAGASGATNQGIPVEPNYGYTYSQMIYTAAEINAAGSITSLKFYKTGSSIANSSGWTIYLGHTSTSSFATATSWLPISGMTQVFSDSVMQVGDEVSVTLTTPFVYNGTDNLVIAIDENQANYDSFSDDFYCLAHGANSSIVYRNDVTNPDPSTPPAATSRPAYVANVEIGGITQSCPSLTGLGANYITSSSANLFWNAGTVSNYQVQYGAAGFTLGTGTNSIVTVDSLNLTGLTGNTGYQFYVRNICASGDTSSWSGPISFATTCGIYTPTYFQDFATYIPGCWTEAQGRLGATSTTMSSTTSSNWTADGLGNIGSTGAARSNVFGTSADEWLISPTIDLGTGTTPYQLEYDIALTSYSGTSSVSFGADDSVVVVISTDNGVTWSLANALQVYTVGNEPSNTGDFTILSLSGYTGLVKLGFYAASSVSNVDNNIFIDNFKVTTVPSCLQPTSVSVDSLTSTSAFVSWNVGATNSIIEYGMTGFTLGTGTTINTTGSLDTITGLLSNTGYDFYVKDSCGIGNVSAWTGPITFTTNCGIYTPTYLEDFASFSPTCWSQFQGILGATATTVTNTTTSNWSADGFGNVGSTGSARMNIYGTGRDEWLISPTIDLGTGATPYQLEYDVALTPYTGSVSATFGPDDTMAVVISTDNGVTWSQVNTLKLYTAGTEPSNTGDFTVIPLTGYTGLVKFGFYAASSVTNVDNNIYIDNFKVTPVPTCAKPTNVSATVLTTTSASLSWTGTATSSQIEYGFTGYTPGTGTSVLVGASPYTLTGLTADTTYDFYVRDICTVGDSSEWSTISSFYTGYCVPSPTSVDANGITNVTMGTINNTTGVETNNYGNYSAQVANFAQGETVACDITFETGYTYETNIWVDWNQDLTFDASEMVYTGTSTIASPTILNASFIVPAAQALGVYRVRIGGADNATTDPCYTGAYATYEDYSINVTPCIAPAITTQPIGITACENTSGSASVVATGTGLSYDWQTGGVSVGTTDTLTNPSIVASNAGNYLVIVSNACGSVTSNIVTLTVLLADSVTDTQVACDSLVWIDGITYTASNNTATFNLTNAAGCDSVVTLDLTINNSYAVTDVQVACDSLVWIDGITYTASNNTAMYTTTTAAGCDSIVTLDLTINNSSTGIDTQVACDSLVWIDGVTYTTSNNTATFTMQNASGCDSVVTLDLTINNSAMTTDTQIACGPFTWIDGMTYTTSNNTATYTTTTAAGCDSVVTLDLTIVTNDITVSQTGGVNLSSNETAAGVTYRWLDCDNGNVAIAGETNQAFTATANGNYAVEITNGTCVDTSACMTVGNVGIDENSSLDFASVSPNPTTDYLTVTMTNTSSVQLEMVDAQGKVIISTVLVENGSKIDLRNFENGMYFVRLTSEKGTALHRVVKK